MEKKNVVIQELINSLRNLQAESFTSIDLSVEQDKPHRKNKIVLTPIETINFVALLPTTEDGWPIFPYITEDDITNWLTGLV